MNSSSLYSTVSNHAHSSLRETNKLYGPLDALEEITPSSHEGWAWKTSAEKEGSATMFVKCSSLQAALQICWTVLRQPSHEVTVFNAFYKGFWRTCLPLHFLCTLIQYICIHCCPPVFFCFRQTPCMVSFWNHVFKSSFSFDKLVVPISFLHDPSEQVPTSLRRMWESAIHVDLRCSISRFFIWLEEMSLDHFNISAFCFMRKPLVMKKGFSYQYALNEYLRNFEGLGVPTNFFFVR